MENKESKKHSWGKMLLKFVIAPILLLVGLSLFYLNLIPKRCDTKICFVENANNCRKVKMEKTDEAGTLWSYHAQAGCRFFEKKAVKLNEKESPIIKNLLEGKSMRCEYEYPNFNEQWIDNSILGLEKCQGKLKEALGQLLFLSE